MDFATPTLGTLVLKRRFVLPNARKYCTVFGYIQRSPNLTRVFSDSAGRNRVLSVYNDEVVRIRGDIEVPYNGVFDATKFVPNKKQGE